jgi:hypothetical protein
LLLKGILAVSTHGGKDQVSSSKIRNLKLIHKQMSLNVFVSFGRIETRPKKGFGHFSFFK